MNSKKKAKLPSVATAASTTKKKTAAKKSSSSIQEPTDPFAWYETCKDFLHKNNANRISSLDDPRVNVIDRYLKMVMDGLRGHPQILGFFEGSPLNAISFFLKDRYNQPETELMPQSFTLLVYKRVQEDLTLRKIFNAKGHSRSKAKLEAARKLKERGLLT